jgi:hypothetical protein
MPMNDTALRANTQPAPTPATISPPMAGPTARATFMFNPFSAAACGNTARSTRSGWIACQAGAATAFPQPRAKVSSRISHGCCTPRKAAPASAAAARNMASWAPSSSRLRSIRSAHAPAGNASNTIGRLEAVCTSDTSSGDSSISSHCAPTVCIQVPTFDTNWAIHSARKIGNRLSGAHAETGRSALVPATMPIPYQSRTAAYNSTDAEFRCTVRGERNVTVFPVRLR